MSDLPAGENDLIDDPQGAGVCFVYTTFPDPATAQEICGFLVNARLAACANIFPGMTAIYEWQGGLETETECAAFLKTQDAVRAALAAELKRRHPYDTPAIVTLPVSHCDRDYFDWLRQQTKPRQGG